MLNNEKSMKVFDKPQKYFHKLSVLDWGSEKQKNLIPTTLDSYTKILDLSC